MPISYKNKIYTTLGTPTVASGNGAFVTNSVGVPAKDYTVKGNTIVWNQMFQNPNFSNTVVDTREYVGFSVQQLASPYEVFFYRILQEPGLVSGVFTITASGNCRIKHNGSEHDIDFFYFTPVKDHKYYIYFNFTSTNPTVAGGVTYNKAQFFDLTQMFGAGNEPATPAEFQSMFPDDYYPYNAGELKSVVPTSVEASGIERFQLLDKSKYSATTTISGVTFTNNGDGTITANGTATSRAVFYLRDSTNSVMIRGKGFIVGDPEAGNAFINYDLYDDNKWVADNASYGGKGNIFTGRKEATYGVVYIAIEAGTSANNLIFKPQLFDLTQMFGAGNEPATPAEFWQRVPEKLYGYNPNDYKSANIPSSKYFPDGMKSAGSVYDEINFLSQKAIKRVGAVDMGTLNWSYSTTRTAFQTDDLNTKIEFPVTSSDTANLICTKYSVESYVSGWSGTIDKCCGTTFATAIKWFWVRDTTYTDAAAFKAAMSGVMLYYELATPVETAITPPLQALSTFKGFTSFSAPNSLMQNGPLSVTYYAEGGSNPESGWLTSYKRKLYMGRNIEWNQLLDKSKYPTTGVFDGVTYTNNGDGTITLNGTATAGTDSNYNLQSDISVMVNHKYFCYYPKSEAFVYLYTVEPDVFDNRLPELSNYIVTARKNNDKLYFQFNVSGGKTVSNLIFKPQLFDLTQMFGAGNEPATPEEFWSYFDHKLYPYNAGETQPLFKISRKSQWGSAVSYPNKGDLINIEGKQYRVLKTNGNVAEVLTMYNPSSVPQRFGTTQIYANSLADTYCNETFYSGLSSALQNAIVEKTFTQDSWFRGDSGHSSAIEVYQGVSTDINYVMSLMNKSFGTSITRKCYMISIQDIIDYIGATTAMTVETTTLKQENIWKLFWNQSTKPGTGAFYYPWLRSASANDSYTVFDINSNTGRLDYDSSQNEYIIRPAFQIDLSKISWTKSE